MKKVSLFLLMMSLLFTSGISGQTVTDGDSFTKFGKYKIESSENPFILNGKELKTYLIRYENAGLTLMVTADKSGDKTRFLTITDALAVQYVSHKNFFGVEKIDPKYVASALKTSDSALNRYEYFHQKVLTTWELSELEKIKLIATYYPSLLNNIDMLLSAK